MSPEQARGLEVDARTDIWSSGAVLYETVTGRVAFTGTTPSDVVASILERDPAPLVRVAPDVPYELERIVSKSLAKDREERYQTTKDLLIDLRRLKRNLEIDVERERAGEWSADTKPRTDPEQALTGDQSLRQVSRGRYIVRQLKRHKRLALSLLLALIAAISIFKYFSSSSSSISSIAVLPFLTTGSDRDIEYIASGISENIINRFAGLPELRVVPLSMVSHYKGQEIDSIKVGKELGVGAVLTGRVFKKDDALIVKVDLVNVTDEKQLLVKSYSRTSSDVLGGAAIAAMQEDISKQVFEELRSKLTAEH
jgi:TolB-like protein